jgi:hypothetical protein
MTLETNTPAGIPAGYERVSTDTESYLESE